MTSKPRVGVVSFLVAVSCLGPFLLVSPVEAGVQRTVLVEETGWST